MDETARPQTAARARAEAEQDTRGRVPGLRPLLLLALALTACSSTPTPKPAPALTLTRPDALHVAATLTPAPARARWTLQASKDCGAEAGPVRAGEWAAPSLTLVQEATRGDLLIVWADGVRLADCVPPVGWNSAQGIPAR